MRRMTTAALRGAVCCGILFALGCEDPKKQISQLQEEKKVLSQQLMEANQSRDTAQAEASELKQRNAQLQTELTQTKQAPAPTAAPVAAPPPASLKFVGAITGTDFGRANKPELSSQAKAQLDQMVSEIRSKYGKDAIYVIGHTDNDPIRKTKWTDNLELSAERAMAVARYLGSKGIARTHLVAGGMGEYDPIVPNTGNANKAKNRRIEIYAGPKPSRQ